MTDPDARRAATTADLQRELTRAIAYFHSPQFALLLRCIGVEAELALLDVAAARQTVAKLLSLTVEARVALEADIWARTVTPLQLQADFDR